MKILHVLYSGLGGHGNVFFSMLSADANHEFEYEVLFNGIEEVRTEYINTCNESGIKWSFVKKKKGLDLQYYKSLVKFIKTSNADILFLHSSTYILPAKHAQLISSKKKKIIVRETQANNLKNKREWGWLFLAFLLANKIVFLSIEYRDEIEKRLSWFYNKSKVAVIPNGIDLNKFYPKKKVSREPVIIGMQSRLTVNKDHPTLLAAFAKLKNENYNINLKVAGDGTCKSELILLAQHLKIDTHTKFTGTLDEEELVHFLQDLDIYVHASFGETMSTAIMQAMACGLPVIASEVPGIKNMIINNRTGILVPVKNVKSMSDALEYLLNNIPIAEALGENAYRFAKDNYSNSVMFKRYKEIFTS